MVGSQIVKYAVVVSSGEAITMVVQITSGRKAWIEAPMLIFMNKSHDNYPIRGLPDNVLRCVLPNGSQRLNRYAHICNLV